ncbi:MAG: hypothetical protein JO322_04580, partial [Candidatus Eremiobacteraeota bacterium]|nr:hypothetical protein [Candidatus Eremiobacteraeota bacterium]
MTRGALLGGVARNLFAPLLLLLATSVSVTLVCAGQTYLHRRFNERDFVLHNEVAGFIVSVTGTLYSVILGFLTLVAWQHHTDANQLVALESAAAEVLNLRTPVRRTRRAQRSSNSARCMMTSNGTSRTMRALCRGLNGSYFFSARHA